MQEEETWTTWCAVKHQLNFIQNTFHTGGGGADRDLGDYGLSHRYKSNWIETLIGPAAEPYDAMFIHSDSARSLTATNFANVAADFFRSNN